MTTEQQLDQVAKDNEQAAINSAETAFANAKSAIDGTYQSTLTSDQVAADGTLAADQAVYDARAAADDRTYNATVDSDLTVFQNADAANQATYNSQVDAAAATRDNTIGANSYLWDDAFAQTDPGFITAQQIAADDYNNAVAGFAAIADQADVNADTAFNNTKTSLTLARDQADQQSQTTYNNSIQTANGNCAGKDAIVEAGYGSAKAQDQAEYDNSVQIADAQYATDRQNANDTEAQTDAGVDGAFSIAAQSAKDAYNTDVANRTTQYANARASRDAALATQLASEQTAYNNAVIQAATIKTNADEQATDAYNNAVAGFQQTRSGKDVTAWASYNTAMNSADQVLAAAWDTYNTTVNQIVMTAMNNNQPPDQAALDAAEATLNAAQHQFANIDASQSQILQAAIGADAVDYENSEEGAYVTWQDALSQDRGTYDMAVADATQTFSDAVAGDQAVYEGDVAQMIASYNTDIANKQAALTLLMASLSQTRVMGEEAAAETCTAALATAAAKDSKAIAAADTIQSNKDVLAYQTEQNGLAADQKDLHKDIADAEMTLGQETSAHNQTFQAGLAAAAVTQEHAWADAEAAYELNSAGAAATYEAAVMQAEANVIVAASGNDPATIAVANAWLQFTADTNAASLRYEQADVAAWLTEQTADTAAWLADVSDKDAAEAQQESGDRAAKYQQMNDDATAAVKDVNDTMTANIPRMNKEAAASETSIGIQADDMVAKVAKDIAATLVQTTSLVSDALEWWQNVTNAWSAMVADVESAGVTDNTAIANDVAAAIHGLDAADDAEAHALAPKAEEADHKAAVAHQVYGPKYISLEKQQSDAEAAFHAANVAGLLDSAFAGLSPGSRETFVQTLGDHPEETIPALFWLYTEVLDTKGLSFDSFVKNYAEAQLSVGQFLPHAGIPNLTTAVLYTPPSKLVPLYEQITKDERPETEPSEPGIGARVLMPTDPLELPSWSNGSFEDFVNAMYQRKKDFPNITEGELRNAILATKGGREFLMEYEQAYHEIFIEIRNELSHLREIEEQFRNMEEWEKEYNRLNQRRNDLESWGKRAWNRNPKQIPPKGQREWRK